MPSSAADNTTTAEAWTIHLVDIRRHFQSDEQMAAAFDAVDDRLPETLALCGGNVTAETFAAAMKTISDRVTP